MADAMAVDWSAPSSRASVGGLASEVGGSRGAGAGEDGGKVSRWRAGAGGWGGGVDGCAQWQFKDIGFDVATLRTQLATRNAEVRYHPGDNPGANRWFR